MEKRHVTLAQGACYVLTALWAVRSVGTFQEVTGPKTDAPFLKTVGVVGGASGRDRRLHLAGVPARCVGRAAHPGGLDLPPAARMRLAGVLLHAGGSAGAVVGLCAPLAALHSLLATRGAKELALRLAGRRYRDGLYRPFYNALSLVLLAWAARRLARLPDRDLYRVEPPWSWALRAGQLASLGVVLATVWAAGLRSTGVPQLRSLLAGTEPVPPPDAQGPPPGADGEMAPSGPYHLSRHPSNLASAAMFALSPRMMTVNRATLAAITALYAVMGAVHEERRLLAAYGDAYERYRAAVPFLLPGPGWRRP